MASFMSYFGGRRDPKASARDAIVTLRQQLQMIEKKEEYLYKKIEEETKKAKASVITNKAAATAALRRKKASETELDRLAGTRLQLEMQVNTLESANLNAETMAAIKKASEAMKVIHGNTTIDQVDATMADVNEQRAIADEIAQAISNPTGQDLDAEAELLDELNQMEEDVLNDRLAGAEHVPVHQPSGASRIETPSRPVAAQLDEDEELRALQAELAM